MDQKNSETQVLEEKTFTPEQLKQALWDWDDVMHRALLQSRYVLLGDTARAAKDDTLLEKAPLEVGIFKRYLTPEVRSIFTPEALRDIAVPIIVTEFNDDHILLTFRGVPIHVKIIHRRYEFFENLDQVIYAFEDFQIANPFEKYYKARYIIK